MPPPPGPRRPARSNRHRSVADFTASATSRGKARPTSGAGSASARPISCSGTGRPSLLPIAAAIRCGRGTLRDHALGDPAGHRRLVITQCQTPLRTKVVDPPGESGVADARQGEKGAEFLVRPAVFSVHCGSPRDAAGAGRPGLDHVVGYGGRPPLGPIQPPWKPLCGRLGVCAGHPSRPYGREPGTPSVVRRIPTVKSLVPDGRKPAPGRKCTGCGLRTIRRVLPVYVAVRPAVRSVPPRTAPLAWASWVGPCLRQAVMPGRGGPGGSAATIPAGGGPARGARTASRAVDPVSRSVKRVPGRVSARIDVP